MRDAERQELVDRLLFARYLPFPERFDAGMLLREAAPLFREFVAHREELGAGGWRALAVRNADGVAESVGRLSLQRSHSRATRVAEACPATIAAINQFSIFERVTRARYMLLDPGAIIAPHRDSDEPMSLTLNLCITYPDGCRFAVGVDQNGDGGTVVPFAPGTSVLLNVAERHTVRNESEQARLHIVVEGPLRFTNKDLLGFARDFTRTVSISEVRATLLRRYLATSVSAAR